MLFDPNCKNIAPLFLAHVQNGQIAYRRITMEKPYAQVGEDGVQYSGPPTIDQNPSDLKIGIFGPQAETVVRSPQAQDYLSKLNAHGQHYSLLAIRSDSSWGKASSDLVKAVYEKHALALIALDRPSSHLAEQIAVKSFIPVVAISSDHALTSTNIPWIFRLPTNTHLNKALGCILAAIKEAGPNRSAIRASLASGKPLAGVSFGPTGEAPQ
jgi:branched-chain amino acid transport system substrate-binding protein